MPDFELSVLFVDDEARILQGLENGLYKLRDRWQMRFVNSGANALEELARRPYDAIVSDMSMPGMTGTELLIRTQEDFPETARLALSAHAEMEATLRAVPIAHHYLVKPCPIETIVETISRACQLQQMVKSEAVLAAMNCIHALPPAPRIYHQLNAALVDPETPISAIATILQRDPSLCAEVFRLVNSAEFSLRKRVCSVEQAATYLGINMLKSMVLSIEAFRAHEFRSIKERDLVERIQSHSLLTALLARRIMPGKAEADNAFLASILHNIGQLILAWQHGTVLQHVRAQAAKRQEAEWVIEEELLGATHGQMGAYLLGVWGLPYTLVEVAAYHHCPWQVRHARFAEVDAVYVSSLLIREMTGALEGGESLEPLNTDYLRGLGVLSHLEQWRATALELVYTQRESERR